MPGGRNRGFPKSGLGETEIGFVQCHARGSCWRLPGLCIVGECFLDRCSRGGEDRDQTRSSVGFITVMSLLRRLRGPELNRGLIPRAEVKEANPLSARDTLRLHGWPAARPARLSVANRHTCKGLLPRLLTAPQGDASNPRLAIREAEATAPVHERPPRLCTHLSWPSRPPCEVGVTLGCPTSCESLSLPSLPPDGCRVPTRGTCREVSRCAAAGALPNCDLDKLRGGGRGRHRRECCGFSQGEAAAHNTKASLEINVHVYVPPSPWPQEMHNHYKNSRIRKQR